MVEDYEEKLLLSINSLEEEISKADLINLKNKLILTTKKSLVNLKKAIPYCLITGVTFSFFSVFYSLPFVNDTRRRNVWYKKVMDSNGNISITEQSEKYNDKSEVSFVSGWTHIGRNNYQRTITVYPVKSFTEEEIRNLIMTNNISLENLLGPSILTKVESSNTVSKEEALNPGFIRATIYIESEDKYVYVKESATDNNIATLLWLLLTATGYAFVALYKSMLGDEYNAKIHNLEEKYAPLDIETMQKKLEIRKESYNRLYR